LTTPWHAKPTLVPLLPCLPQYAALDCSEIDYAYCEDMKAKAEPIAAAMWVKIGACNC